MIDSANYEFPYSYLVLGIGWNNKKIHGQNNQTIIVYAKKRALPTGIFLTISTSQLTLP